MFCWKDIMLKEIILFNITPIYHMFSVGEGFQIEFFSSGIRFRQKISKFYNINGRISRTAEAKNFIEHSF